MKKALGLALLCAVLAAPSICLGGANVTTATMSVYKAYLYTNSTCTGTPETIFDYGGSPQSYDLATTPSMGTGTVADGTYQCFALKMSDQVSFTPAQDDGTYCKAGTSYTMDVCQPRTGYAPNFYDPDGDTWTACASGSQTVWVYISTESTSTSGTSSNNPFAPPQTGGGCDAQAGSFTECGMKLNNNIVVSGTTTGTFVFGTDGKVESNENDGECDMEQPDWGFQ